ncbi:MAG: alpha/beta fold hydrolase [Acidobacteriota bacterium]
MSVGPMYRVLIGLLIAIAVLYLGACVALLVFQRSLIYYPQAAPDFDPRTTMTLSVPGAELKVSTRPRPAARALLYFGGNAEDVAASLPALANAVPETALYLPHYRGYGGSSGRPSQEALVADALALFDRVHAEHDEVGVIGRSLGSGVAVQLASLRPVRRLVLVTPFASLVDVAERQFPYVPVRWIVWDKFESWRYAPSIRAPTVVVVAERDEIVPRQSTELLFSHFAKGIAVMEVIPGAGHNSISDSPAYMRALWAGIERAPPAQGLPQRQARRTPPG